MANFGPLIAAVEELIQLVLGVPEPGDWPEPWPEPIDHAVGDTRTPIRPAAPAADAVLATQPAVAGALAGLSAELRTSALRNRLKHVVAYLEELDPRPAPAVSPLAILDRIDAAIVELPAFKWALTDTDPRQTPFDDVGRRLRLSQPQSGLEPIETTTALVLVQEARERGVNAVDLSQFVADGDEWKASELLAQLRRLDDVYKRWDIANRAAGASSVSLAQMLALYRTEGDMLVPPSIGSLLGTDLPKLADRFVPWPTGRTGFVPFLAFPPSFEFGVWVADRARVDAVGFEHRARELADIHWHLAMAGLDIMYEKLFRPPFLEGRMSMQGWLNWLQPNAGTDVHRAWRQYKATMGLLRLVPEQTVPAGAQPVAWVAAPTDPVKYASDIMTIAGRHFAKCHERRYLFGDVAGTVPEVIAYLGYHQQQRGARAVLLSALAHAHRGRTGVGKPLRDAIDRDARPDSIGLLREVPAMDPIQAADAAADNWGLIGQLLLTGNNLDTAAEFITNARRADWTTFLRDAEGSSVRGNILRYLQLYTFYRGWLQHAE
jgi:hypothetical protein